MCTTNKNIGSNFDDFLKEEGIFEEVQLTALLKVYLRVGEKLKSALVSLTQVEDKATFTHEEVFKSLHYAEANEDLLVDASCISMELADLLDNFLPEGTVE